MQQSRRIIVHKCMADLPVFFRRLLLTIIVTTALQTALHIAFGRSMKSSNSQSSINNTQMLSHIKASGQLAPDTARFAVLVLYENGGHHLAYSKAATAFLNRWSKQQNFSVHYIQNADLIDSALLSKYQLFIQLDYPPYSWPQRSMQAFRSAVTKGRLGWLGFHHATLLGEFDGYPMWNWFSWFMGGIRFKNYIADFASAYVDVKAPHHPVMQGVHSRFLVSQEEWYIYDQVPGPYIKVLATVDESSYRPDTDIKMHGPHPVIWTNTKVKARNLYIFMGHGPGLWQNPDYVRLFWNALFWTAGKKPMHGFTD